MSDVDLIDVVERLARVEQALAGAESTIRTIFEKIEPILAEVTPMLERIESSPFGKMILGGKKR